MRPDVLIVGAGPAGIAAAVQAKRLGRGVRLVDEQGVAGGLIRAAWQVENYPGLPPLDGESVARILREHLARFDIPVEHERVYGIAPAGRGWLARTAARDVEAASVVLAVGTRPRPVTIAGLEGEADRHVFGELTRLLEAWPPARLAGRTVAVLGGGEAAFDHALRLHALGARSLLIVRGDAPRATGRLPERVRATPGVDLRLETALTGGRVAAGGLVLHLTRGGQEEELPVAALITAVGRLPRLGELALPPLGVGLLEPAPGLFVVGDARFGGLGQLGIAVGDGLLAAGRIAAPHPGGQG